MKLSRRKVFPALFVALLLLIASNGSLRLSSHAMPNMDIMQESKNVSDCISICNSRSSVAETAINPSEREVGKEPNPQPAEPYYLQFLNLALIVGVISIAYFLRHLHWRPPDLFKLNVNYQF